MEKAYWLGRQRASLELAENAATAESRLVHYDLAGRYSVKASSAESRTDLANPSSRSINAARPDPGAE